MSQVKMHVLPGGILPKRQSKGAIGYDVCIRAIVSATKMDPDNKALRKPLFDFKNMPTGRSKEAVSLRRHIYKKGRKLVYCLWPGESVLVGIGFVTEMPIPMFYWVAPRSGLAAKYRIQVTNAPGTVDPDYRGEAGVLVLNSGTNPFELEWGMRIAQIIFSEALLPELKTIETYEELTASERGAGGFGSTGITNKPKTRQ